MPKRPRSHALEDIAGAQLRNVFSTAGWTTERLRSDYGEDFLVRIFDDGEATELSFFVQSKSTESLVGQMTSGGTLISVRVSVQHANHWQRFAEPVLIAVYDATTEMTYWEIVQDYLDERVGPDREDAETRVVHVPVENVLNEAGVRSIRRRTRRRAGRLQTQRDAMSAFLDAIEEHWGVKVENGADSENFILPSGKFFPEPSGEAQVVFFGELARRLDDVCRRREMAPEDVLVSALDKMLDDVEKLRLGTPVRVSIPGGGSKEVDSLPEFRAALRRLSREY